MEKREDFFDFDRRFEKAKTHPDFEKVKQWTLWKLGLKPGEPIPPEIDIDAETFQNLGRWIQGQIDINEGLKP